MLLRIVAKAFLGLLAIAGTCALFCVSYALFDLRQFEYEPLARLMGIEGVAFSSAIVLGAAALTYRAAGAAVAGHPLFPRGGIARLALLSWALLILWLADWVFQEKPVTFAVRVAVRGESALDAALRAARAQAASDGSLAAIRGFAPNANADSVAVMVARIKANRPMTYRDAQIGLAIASEAHKYGVSPVLLLHWTYIDSFYGESPPGPMPFFAEINPEMFRDLVQAHLPWWFIESPIRVWLINSDFLDFAGAEFGKKLRYAVQKACYDIAISPYMNSVYSDLFLILREYKAEFPDLFGNTSIDPALRDSFLSLDGSVMRVTNDDPYAGPVADADFYRAHRQDLIDFGRAAVYRLSGDFRFATKVQALVARRYTDEYERRLGKDRWAKVSERQRTALLAILRDVYVPNIGRTSSNLYMVPELNLAPISYVAAEARANSDDLSKVDRTWVPKDGSARLWGATGLMLRVLAEVWQVTSEHGLPGVHPADTINDSLVVLSVQ